MSPEKLDEAIKERFPGCMKGRTMYLVPYSMGPIGGPLSKNGIELTDSAYVAVSMRVMTRVSYLVLGKGTHLVDPLISVIGLVVSSLRVQN